MDKKLSSISIAVMSNGYTLGVHMEDIPHADGEVSPYFSEERYVFYTKDELIEAITKILDEG